MIPTEGGDSKGKDGAWVEEEKEESERSDVTSKQTQTESKENLNKEIAKEVCKFTCISIENFQIQLLQIVLDLKKYLLDVCYYYAYTWH